MNEQIGTKVSAMAEVPSYSASAGTKMFPMKLFSSWEVEKSSPHCIPRLCSLIITRLVIKRVLENELHSVIIAIKMQGSKGMLRSNEILIQKNGMLDAELDITFSLQYSHHLKRDNNRLQIMLQRRKKYKNRTMLGFKTLAVGQVSMSHVLQHPMDRELNLHSCSKDGKSEVVARIVILSLSTQPVDQDKLKIVKDRYRYDASDEDEMQDDGDVSSNDGVSDCETGEETGIPRRRPKTNSLGNAFFNQQKNLKQKFISLIKKFKVTDEVLQSAVQEIGRHEGDRYADDDLFDESLSDSNPDIDTISLQSVPKPKLRPFFDANKSLLVQESQKSYDYDSPGMELSKKEKQDAPSTKKSDKSTELFGKRVSEKTSVEIGLSGQAKKSNERSMNEKEGISKKLVDKSTTELFSSAKKGDKNPEIVKKTEKSSDGKLVADLLTSTKKAEKSSEVRKVETKKLEFDTSVFQKLFQEQVMAITSLEQTLPECIIFMNYMEPLCPMLSSKLQNSKVHVVNATSHSDIKAALNMIVNKVQKLMNTLPLHMKLAIVGSEAYVHSVVRPYVKLMSSRSSELVNHVKFLVVPFGTSSLCHNLAQVDSRYAKLFNDSFWRDLNTDKPEDVDSEEVASRIMAYISEASYVVQLPFAEVVLTYKDKGIDDSSQMVVPFLGEIKLKPMDIGSDIEESTSSSPPQTSFLDKLKEVTSHTINAIPTGQITLATAAVSSTPVSTVDFASVASSPEELDLQMDYWLLPRQDHVNTGSSEKPIKKDAKVSLKTAFRSVQIFRPHLSCVGSHNAHQQQMFNAPHSETSISSPYSGLSMVFITRDKKQKIMRIGKKSKEFEGLRSQQIDGIGRLICTSKSQNQLLTVNIDGMDWTGIKFFQVASHWQTHFKHLPVLVFDASLDVYT